MDIKRSKINAYKDYMAQKMEQHTDTEYNNLFRKIKECNSEEERNALLKEYDIIYDLENMMKKDANIVLKTTKSLFNFIKKFGCTTGGEYTIIEKYVNAIESEDYETLAEMNINIIEDEN